MGGDGEAGHEAHGPVPGACACAQEQASLWVSEVGDMAKAEADEAVQARHHLVATCSFCSCRLMQAPEDIDIESQPPSGSVPADSAVPEQTPKKRARKPVHGHEGQKPNS